LKLATSNSDYEKVTCPAADWKSHRLRGQIHRGIQVRCSGGCWKI